MNKLIKEYKVEWYINDMCNQSCPYCFCQNKSGYNKLIDPLLISNLCSCLLMLNADFYQFVLLGGEPTIYPDLPEVIRQLRYEFRAQKLAVLISTNAKLGKEYFKSFLEFRDFLSIRFSMHPMFYSETWFDTINYLLENRFNLYCDVLFDLNYKEHTINTLNKLVKLQKKEPETLVQCSTKAIHYPDLNISSDHRWKVLKSFYLEDDLKIVRDYNSIFNYKALPKNENKKYCLVGSNKINLNHLGQVLYFCKYKKEFPSLFYLPPEKFKENLLFIEKCSSNYCQWAKSIIPLQSDSFSELSKLRYNIINNSSED